MNYDRTAAKHQREARRNLKLAERQGKEIRSYRKQIKKTRRVYAEMTSAE